MSSATLSHGTKLHEAQVGITSRQSEQQNLLGPGQSFQDLPAVILDPCLAIYQSRLDPRIFLHKIFA